MIIALALIPIMFVGVQMSNHKKNLKEETKELLPNHLLLNIAGWNKRRSKKRIQGEIEKWCNLGVSTLWKAI